MTETARVYGGSLYELAAEEHLEEEILSEMKEIRALFRENPEYPRLLSEPSIPRKERIGRNDERKNGRDGTENRSVRSGGCPCGARRKAV